jgi:sugar fermentation stimulation protein A
MKFDPPLRTGRLVRRYKRFLADVETPDGVVTVHCPNTGAMTGCSTPGLEVWCSTAPNPARRYPLTLEVVCTPRGRVGVNTARANHLVAEALAEARIAELGEYSRVRREAAIPDALNGRTGRFDFLLQGQDGPCWVEVKSLTLCHAGGRGAFPDAVSERALGHVEALGRRRRLGERAVLLFCVQHSGVRFATPADEVHPAYGAALRAAAGAGVEVLAYGCRIERCGMTLTGRLPVRL